MTRRRLRYLERVHLVRTLINYGPLAGAELADIANGECDLDAFDALPPLSRRGIAQKLSAMSLDGMVHGEWPGDGKPMVWNVTDHGRRVARTFEGEELGRVA